jgi:hypothetical protein
VNPDAPYDPPEPKLRQRPGETLYEFRQRIFDPARRKTRLPRSHLPIVAPPAHCEWPDSYLTRLAALNHMATNTLRSALGLPTRVHTSTDITVELLGALTGYPAAQISRAMPELAPAHADPHLYMGTPWQACPRCAARFPGGTVERLYRHHEHACLRHQIWIGQYIYHPDFRFHSIDRLPEVLTAAHRHRELARRHGEDAVRNAYVLAGNFIRTLPWPFSEQATTIARTLNRNIEIEQGPDAEELRWRAGHVLSRIIGYPTQVRLTQLLTSRHWRQTAADPTARGRFLDELSIRALGTPGLLPHARSELSLWIEQQVTTRLIEKAAMPRATR